MKYFILILGLVIVGCESNDSLLQSIDSSKVGIDFSNDLTETEDFNILDYLYFYNGGGVAIGDINNDGKPDIYFSGNQVKNKLYLNKGNLKFEDITESAGVAGNSDWNTGAVMGDINGDGLLDIYVCAVVGVRGLGGYNELFINNGDNTFTESSEEYGLDFDSYSSSASFLDFDKDGDIDIFLLNHAIHTQESFGHARLRYKRIYETGDKLLRNDGGTFVDVSEEAGIYGGVNSYGLGVAISDFNQDGFPDIYVGNDFHEDDYYYLNNGDGTFTESLRDYFGFTTRFSMGNDVADLNHDGWPDLISLDMLPEDEKVLKSSEGDEDFNIMRLRKQRYGYHYQFSRNTLQMNSSGGQFIETALLNGVSATDWSWSALFADFNLDGKQDLFISNGIPRRPNDLDYIKFVSSDQIKNKIDATKLVDQEALELMPTGSVENYVFEGSDLGFKDRSKQWMSGDKSFSTATAIADLDNDGDLDVVINNVNAAPTLLINQVDPNSSYLKLRFNYKPENKFGIGTKVLAYSEGHLQYKELYTVRGFQASSEPVVHFGFGGISVIDSIRVIWPDGMSQVLKDIQVNQDLMISPKDTQNLNVFPKPGSERLFKRVEGNLNIDFVHEEDLYVDFDRQKLIPYQVSDRGPATAIGDLNGDGLDDLFFGGSKYIPSQTYIQTTTGYERKQIPVLDSDSIKEDVVASIIDLNGDGYNDIITGSGGADFFNEMEPLSDSYFLGSEGGFEISDFPRFFENASVIAPCDYDQDGDLDLFIGSQSVSNDFGNIPTSYLLQNEGGKFLAVENGDLQNAGMVTDAIWQDYDGDGDHDLIMVGEWMPPKFFRNDNNDMVFDDLLRENLSGLWQSLTPFDIDRDGDMDYALGNWGLNSKFVASEEFPMKMFYDDFDGNGTTETIITTAKKGKFYPLEGLDGLAGQLVELRKKYTTYKDFAGQTVDQIFGKDLKEAKTLEVTTLESGYLKNNDGNFQFLPFARELQVAPITTLLTYDFNGDGNKELLTAGNYFGVKPYHGRFGSFQGALVMNEEEYKLGNDLGLDLMNKSARDLNIITLNNNNYLLVTIHNGAAEVYNIGK